MCHGEFLTNWKGIPFLKSPLDIAIYQSLMWELKPATIIELGAYGGGAAIWMADMMELWGVPAKIYSVDINLGLLDEKAKSCKHVSFLQGDVNNMEAIFSSEELQV